MVANLDVSILHAGATARTNAEFGHGVGPILLDDVSCTGLEYELLLCPNRGIGVTNCGHHQDAGVSCLPGMYYS